MTLFKKVTAFLLAVVLCFSCLSVLAFAQETTKPLGYVVLGDSIAWGSGIRNSEEACYGKIVADTNGYTYSNYGVNGYTTTNLLNLLTENENARNDVKNADIISISIGGNDFLQQNLPVLITKTALGDYEILNDITEILNENFAEIIDIINELNGYGTIIVQTVYNPRTDFLRDIYGMAVERVNNCIYSYLEQNPGAYEILDVRPIFDGHKEYVAVDTIHPSAAGNIEIAKLLLQKLCDLGISSNTEPVLTTKGIDLIPFYSEIIQFFNQIFQKIKEFFAILF